LAVYLPPIGAFFLATEFFFFFFFFFFFLYFILLRLLEFCYFWQILAILARLVGIFEQTIDY
jgi:hypothetical protein